MVWRNIGQISKTPCHRIMINLSRSAAERVAIALLAALAGLLVFVPPIAQPQGYHQLADERPLSFGVFVLPNAADVLTSLLITLVGIRGLLLSAIAAHAQRVPLGLFFSGLMLTGFGSVWYHLSPSDESLVWDRLPMALAFAGVVGAVATERLGTAAGGRWLAVWLVLALCSVLVWVLTGDLRLYGIAQFGGFAILLLWVRLAAVDGMACLPWGWLLLAYLAAKGFEVLDREVWTLTGGVIAGHALKHVLVAVGVVALLHRMQKGVRQGKKKSRGVSA